MAPFGGWLMPIQYEGILAEHAHTRNQVSVFDICHMGEFILEADAFSSGFDRVVTQNITGMPPGTCRYGHMLNDKAGIIDDLIVYRLKEKSWMIVVNAATIRSDEDNLKNNLTGEFTFNNVSNITGKLDLQGPRSLEAIRGIFGSKVEMLSYYTFGEFDFSSQRCIISRTGYTGELGYEIYVPSEHVASLWARLLEDSRVKPAGLGCRDTLRLEMGYPLYGHDINLEYSPVSAGLDKFVDYSKDFIGKQALLKEKESGPKERLIYFKSDSRRSARHGFGIYSQSKRVGTVTSGSFSPSLGVSIGMGYIRGNHKIGDQLLIKEDNIEIPVVIVEKPFYSGARPN